MRRVFSAFLALATAPAALACAADESLADRARAICDAVQVHHAEAPPRQQMIHAGILAMYRAVEAPPPGGLGERISGLTTPDQFAALLAEVRPKPGGAAKTEEALDRAFLDGLAASVPGGVAILEAKESKVAEQIAGNRYVGIQISVSLDGASKLPRVESVFEGGPAHGAGMKQGDLIEAVDGEALVGLSLAEYLDKLRGEEGTDVTVAVRGAGDKEPRSLRMTRRAMRHATIQGPAGRPDLPTPATGAAPSAARPDGFRISGPAPIGYLKIESILASTPREVREAAAKMEAEGLEAVVIDLRQRQGGPSTEGIHPAVLLADELLDSGTIGRVRLASRQITYRAEPGSVFAGWPMAVLVDGSTSGYAEWIAAALKANGRARIVGTDTAGVGASRSTVPLGGEGGRTASLVTGLLEGPDGRLIGDLSPTKLSFPAMIDPAAPRPRLGVTPDLAISPKQPAGAEDAALKAALDLLARAIRRPETGAGVGASRVPLGDGKGTR